MNGEILHRLGQRGGVRGSDRLLRDIITAQRAHQRHALGCAERQIKTMHTAGAECTPPRAARRNPVIKPTRHHRRVGLPTRALHITQTHQPRRRASIARAQPHRGARLVFGVVLPQPAIRALRIRACTRSCCGGVDVIADRRPLQLRNRQHQQTNSPTERSTLTAPQPFWHTVQMCQSVLRMLLHVIVCSVGDLAAIRIGWLMRSDVGNGWQLLRSLGGQSDERLHFFAA